MCRRLEVENARLIAEEKNAFGFEEYAVLDCSGRRLATVVVLSSTLSYSLNSFFRFLLVFY